MYKFDVESALKGLFGELMIDEQKETLTGIIGKLCCLDEITQGELKSLKVIEKISVDQWKLFQVKYVLGLYNKYYRPEIIRPTERRANEAMGQQNRSAERVGEVSSHHIHGSDSSES